MKKSSLNRFILMDVIFYAAVPYLIWEYGRDLVGDYAAILISSVPGIVYTCYRFFVEKQFNITGLFILGSLVLDNVADILSGSAERMLQNDIYLGLFYVMIHLFAFIIKRPFSLYFAVDFAYMLGYKRKDSLWLYFQKGIFKWFQIIQLCFIIRGLFMAGLTAFLLQRYSVDGYGKMLIYKQVLGWFFSILITGLFIYINIPIQKFLESRLDRPEGNEKKQQFSGKATE